MSEEKAEIVRRIIGVFNEGSVSATAEYWTPDITWQTDPNVPEPGVYEGKAEVTAYLQGWVRAFGDSFRIKVHEIIDLADNDVLVVTTVSGHPLGDTQRDTVPELGVHPDPARGKDRGLSQLLRQGAGF